MYQRVARSIGVALLTLTTAIVIGLASTVSSAVQLLAVVCDACTALVMSGTFTPTPPPAFLKMAENQFVVPTHPDQNIGPYLPITTPEQAWPVTGLFDYPFGTSVRIGQQNLEDAMALYGNDNLVIFGHSQSSVIAYREKTKLAAMYPDAETAPNIQFVTIGTLNLPNGGVMTRFWGGYLPFVDFYFNGPAPTDTPFHTDIITQRWDGFADFPIYPINFLSDLNAVAGIFYVHEEYEDVTLAGDPSKYFRGTHGDTDYYFFDTENLPLFGPLRSFGVPEALIDVVEPLTTFLVELGYRRDIPLWVPSPARLIPIQNPITVVQDFVAAVAQTIDNTRALVSPPPPVAPAPADVAAARVAASPPPVTSQSAPPSEAEPTALSIASVGDEQVDGTEAVAEPADEPESVARATHSTRHVLPSSATPTGPRSGELLHRGQRPAAVATPSTVPVSSPDVGPASDQSSTAGQPGDASATNGSPASDGESGNETTR